MHKNVTVVGAGLAGSLLSILLAKRGFNVTVFEKRADIRTKGYVGGRSINLALSDRGLKALDIAGIKEDILQIAIGMTGRMMHGKAGELAYQPYGHNDQAIYSVSRGGLNLRLLELADSMDNITIHFNHDCVECNLETAKTEFVNENGETVINEADWVIATDGSTSAVRYAFQKSGMFNYEQKYEQHGYKELEIMPLSNQEWSMNKNCLHIWPRKSFMMIALPNPNKTFTCTLFMPFTGNQGLNNLQTEAEIETFFMEEFADAIPLMPNYIEDMQNNPTGNLVTVRCYPWVKGKTALLGDSAHAIVPFYGQGMNCCFEDCVALYSLLEKNEDNLDIALKLYEEERVINANAIADLALQNFIEMRDKVGNPDFLERKKLEHEIAEIYPNYKSQYELVTFSPDTSYHHALTTGAKNDALIDFILHNKHQGKITDKSFMEDLFKSYLLN